LRKMSIPFFIFLKILVPRISGHCCVYASKKFTGLMTGIATAIRSST